MRSHLLLAAIWLASSGQQIFAAVDDLRHAPPAFAYQQNMAVPIDIQTIDLTMVFDVAQRAVLASAEIHFNAEQNGYPFFDLVANPTSLELNGTVATTAVIDDPTKATKLRVVNALVDANSNNVIKLTYRLPSTDVTFENGTVSAGFFMDDLSAGGRQFWEQYGPSNVEFDQFQQTMHVQVIGAKVAHQVFTNGASSETAANEWTIDFPDYFTSSSFYFHLVPVGKFQVRAGTYISIDGRTIPVTSYASSASSAQSGYTNALAVLAELENTYGPYAHASLTAYITPGGGGMEHCGATMTSLWALEHEVTHSWFARGVMPANGNAGWIDEATASWRDDGYQRASRAPSRSPVNLGGFSQYRRHTTRDAYTLGAQLLSEFDYMFKDFGFEGTTGLRGIMRQFFAEQKRQTITVGLFKDFLERVTGANLTAIFDRYVYGRSQGVDQGAWGDSAFDALSASPDVGQPARSRHPRPFTRDERRALR